MADQMMHPNYKFLKEMRERLNRYGILSLHGLQHESYSLKYVKLPSDDVESNPILQKAQDYKNLVQDQSESAVAQKKEESEILQEMSDTIYIDSQMPSTTGQ